MGRFSKIAVTMLSGLYAACLAPGCVIQIGSTGGDGDLGGGGATQTNTSDTGTSTDTTSMGLTPDQQAAFDNADPQQLALRSSAAVYGASALEALVDNQVSDPSTLDPAAIEALAAQFAPQAIEQAEQWATGIDLSSVPVEGGAYPKYECGDEPHKCPYNTSCPFGGDGAICVVTQCGTGKCPWCPFGGNLVFKAWCAYACMRGKEVVGGAFILRTIFNNYNGPWCIKS